MTCGDPRTDCNAEQWHIPPQRQQLGEGMSPVEAAKQPVMAMSVIDLKPLIMWWQSQEQRLRDQVAVERTAASSAREALAVCEERCRMLTSQLELGRLALDHAKRCAEKTQRPGFDYEKILHEQAEKWNHTAAGYVQQIKNLERRAQRAEDHAGKARCERDDALAELERERARFENSLSELRSSATEQTVSLVPGSVPAVIEAYRLLVGDGLEWRRSPGWYDNTTCQSPEMEKATLHLIHWLDQHAPGGKP